MRIVFILCISLFSLNAKNFKSVEILGFEKVFLGEEFTKFFNSDIERKAAIEGCDYLMTIIGEKELINFFQTAHVYDKNDFNPADGFGENYLQTIVYCHFPCRIQGKVKLDSAIYDFDFGADDGLAKLTNGDEVLWIGDKSREYDCGI